MNPHRERHNRKNRINKRQLREMDRIDAMTNLDNALYRNTFLTDRWNSDNGTKDRYAKDVDSGAPSLSSLSTADLAILYEDYSKDDKNKYLSTSQVYSD